jgi:hypothetical protein
LAGDLCKFYANAGHNKHYTPKKGEKNDEEKQIKKAHCVTYAWEGGTTISVKLGRSNHSVAVLWPRQSFIKGFGLF